MNKVDKKPTTNKVHLKTLAIEHEIHCDTYIAIMEQFDNFLWITYRFKIENLKGKALMPWQVHLLRKLNPTDYEINSMVELKEFDDWHQWMSNVMIICADRRVESKNMMILCSHKPDESKMVE
ncbi:hypothetical protein [Arcicella rosea]|uniref:Uncharacterized protein n=1 Tax=Arcicella rosea TaxID=502909 RepID=A0A841EJZ1_9BACT|nr:hypothetical protein [Arcicella rosea]MBB6003862.1 hypothetical protein [Arcicella rosea]